MELELWSVEHQGAHVVGVTPRVVGAPPPSWIGCGPMVLILSPVFLYIPKIFSVKFQVIPRTFISAQK